MVRPLATLSGAPLPLTSAESPTDPEAGGTEQGDAHGDEPQIAARVHPSGGRHHRAGGQHAADWAAARELVPSARPQAQGAAGAGASANDKIQIALIGAGGQGMGDTRVALITPGVEIVAAADIYDGRLTRAKELWGQQVFTSRDYREVLARPDVDAVIIATPDHWHQKIAIDAMNAGKDVYLEKPMVQHAEEGAAIIEAANKTKRIIQIGSQRVSSVIYEKARQLYAVRRDRPAQPGRGLHQPQLGDGRVAIHDSARRVAAEHRLGPLPRPRAEAPVRADPPVPLAQLSGLRHRRRRRPVRPPVLRHPLRAELERADADSGDGRHPLLERRPRRAGRDARDLRLSEDRVASGLQPVPEDQLRGGRRRRKPLPVRRRRRHASPSATSGAGNGCSIQKTKRPKDPGLSIDTFPEALQKQITAEHRKKYPEARGEMRPSDLESFVAPRDYNDSYDHFVTFFNAVRSRKPVSRTPSSACARPAPRCWRTSATSSSGRCSGIRRR